MFKMRWGGFVSNLFLVIFLLYFCNGASAKPPTYSHQEDEFIVQHLEYYASTYDQNTWKLIEAAHAQKVEEKIDGFPIARSVDALQKHFLKVIIKDKSLIKVPDTVKQLYHEKMLKWYSEEERKFINEQLLLGDGQLFSESTWTEIGKKHAENRKSDAPGFLIKRTGRALSLYFRVVMIPQDLVDDAVKQRFQHYFNPDESTRCTLGKKMRGSEYNIHEDELIFEVLERYPSLNNCEIWDVMAEAHKNKVEAEETGFKKQRTPVSLRKRCSYLVKKWKGPLSDTTKQRFPKYFRSRQGFTSTAEENQSEVNEIGNLSLNAKYSRQEKNLIFDILESHSDLKKGEIWDVMAKAHFDKVQAKETGFKTQRTADGLRKYYNRLIKKRMGLLSDDLKQTQPNFSRNEQASTNEEENQADTDQCENPESVNDDNVVWAPILGDLATVQRHTVKSTKVTLPYS